MVFFQLVGAILQFMFGQLAQTQLGLKGTEWLLLLALAPVLIRILALRILRTVDTKPGWWAILLLLALVALSLQA